jgi:hypothetical protein
MVQGKCLFYDATTANISIDGRYVKYKQVAPVKLRNKSRITAGNRVFIVLDKYLVLEP